MGKSADNRTLREKIERYKRDSLGAIASQMGIKGTSKLKKDELIDVIVDAMLDPEVMFYRLSIFDDATMALFEKAINKGCPYSEEDSERAALLSEADYAFNDVGTIFVPGDVGAAYKKVKTKEFEEYRARASWIWKCLDWLQFMYGYAPIDVVLKLANTKKGMKFSEQELTDIYEKFPKDLQYVYRVAEFFVDEVYLDNKEALKELKMNQAGKDYYIPTEAEIIEFFDTMALVSEKSYQNLQKFLINDLDMDEDDAAMLVADLWNEVSESDDLTDTMQWFFDNLQLKGQDQVQKLMQLYNEASNNTRMLYNRGFKPIELLPKGLKPGQMPTIVPGSSHAAQMLAKAAPEMERMGFNLDLDSNADVLPVIDMPYGPYGEQRIIQKKVYPNDPCPCGSGKKYKKCCGR